MDTVLCHIIRAKGKYLLFMVNDKLLCYSESLAENVKEVR